MKNDTTITNELQAIAPYLAQLPKRNAFATPPHYFDGLLDRALSAPTHQADEPSLLNISKGTKFVAPNHYFDSLADKVLGKIKAMDQQPEPTFTKTSAFNVPAGYFDNLADAVLKKASASNSDENALQQLGKNQSFAVPPNYFDGLTDAVLAKSKQQPEAKVFNLKAFIKRSKNVLAVAATVSGIVFGINHFNNKVSTSLVETELTAQDISDYLNNNPEEFDEQALLQKVAEKNDHEEQAASLSDQEILNEEIESSLLDELDESTLNQSL